MPRNVRQFEWLMYAALILAVVSLALQYRYYRPFIEIVLVLYAFWWPFIVLLIWLTARRRKNWARLTLFALFLLDLAVTLWGLAFPRSTEPHSTTVDSVDMAALALEALAYRQVFTADAPAWFRKGPPPPDVTVF